MVLASIFPGLRVVVPERGHYTEAEIPWPVIPPRKTAAMTETSLPFYILRMMGTDNACPVKPSLAYKNEHGEAMLMLYALRRNAKARRIQAAIYNWRYHVLPEGLELSQPSPSM